MALAFPMGINQPNHHPNAFFIKRRSKVNINESLEA